MNSKVVYAWPKASNAHNNPYNKILYDALGDDFILKEFHKKQIDFNECSILHIHWPDRLLRSASKISTSFKVWKFFRLVKKIKKNGGKLVWTVHNMEPHGTYVDNYVKTNIRKIAQEVDGFIFLSETNKRDFFYRYPSVQKKSIATVIPHVHYKDYYRSTSIKSVFIAEEKYLKILFFGMIRPHKGLEKLLIFADQIYLKYNICLMVAGSPGVMGLGSELSALLNADVVKYKKISHVSDQELPGIFSCSDVVILPYEKIFNSGTAILALSMGKKLIAPAMGSLIDLKQLVGDDWVYLYEPPLDIQKLKDAVFWSREPSKSSQPDINSLSPDLVADKMSKFYNKVISSGQIS